MRPVTWLLKKMFLQTRRDHHKPPEAPWASHLFPSKGWHLKNLRRGKRRGYASNAMRSMVRGSLQKA
jgi:hypothetical protein